MGLALSVLAVAPRAEAFEREWHAGGRLGVATLRGRGAGPAFGLHGAYGLSDMFDVTLEAMASRHEGSTGTDVFSAAAGLLYKVDVFEWIPYVGVLAGVYDYAGRPASSGEHGTQVGGAVQLGLDYLATRNLALGAELRFHASLHDGLGFPLFSATLGAEYRWGF